VPAICECLRREPGDDAYRPAPLQAAVTEDPPASSEFPDGRSALVRLGWTPQLEAAFAAQPTPGLLAARVAGAQREIYTLWSGDAVLAATLSGKLRHGAEHGELPAVGDWVVAQPDGSERAIIHDVLPRHTVLARSRAGRSGERQVLAANCDVVFIVSSLNLDWNPRRIERAVALVRASEAQPVLLLTKLDLCPDPSPQLRTASELLPDVPVHTLALPERRGLDALAPYLVPGRTLALLGSSGVGKSTLVNCLLGEERAQTGAIREHDDRGRHTTTRRELYALPSGALVIDTPGIREVGVFDEQSDEHKRPRRRGKSPRSSR
jgi:ribosome biogenesis GTPase / thiamine phosphate phosphatase